MRVNYHFSFVFIEVCITSFKIYEMYYSVIKWNESGNIPFVSDVIAP